MNNNSNINDDKRNNYDNNNSNNSSNVNSNIMDDFSRDDSHAVRDPDPVKKEKLIGNSFYEQTPINYKYYNHYQNFNNPNFNEEEIEKAIEISKNELYVFQDEEYKKIIELIEKENEKERINKFQTIRQKLTRMLAIDKQNSNLYVNILTIITLYESGYVTKYTSSKEEVTSFFKLFNSIRLTNEELMSLKQLFIEDI
jgi:hypothetical protein